MQLNAGFRLIQLTEAPNLNQILTKLNIMGFSFTFQETPSQTMMFTRLENLAFLTLFYAQ